MESGTIGTLGLGFKKANKTNVCYDNVMVSQPTPMTNTALITGY